MITEIINAEQAFEQAYPGVEYDQEQTEICVWWGNFRENRYEQGSFVIGRRVLSAESVSVFNGTETTCTYPAIKDGVPCRFVRTTFHPDFGHASYGQAGFVD